MGMGYGFSALLGVLGKIGIIPDPTEELKSAEIEMMKKMGDFRLLGENIAGKINGETPVIYTTAHFKSLAMIWKIMFNEDSKTPAYWNYFPELNHNEMVGFTKPKANFYLILLEDKNDHPQNLKRFQVTSELLKNYGIESMKIEIPEGEIIYRIFSILQIGCFASYYLAINYEVDPTPVEMVEELKRRLL
jgi:glucose/mannose-6-phosphate isomerase